MKKYLLVTIGVLCMIQGSIYGQSNRNLERATVTLESIYKYYSVENSELLREHYPFKENYKADYLNGGENSNRSNPYAYLWPFSGGLSAQVALYEKTKSENVKNNIDNQVLVGLEKYYDKRLPSGYASYINSAPLSDRFYDDNVWLGIDFADLYLLTKEEQYLKKALEIWSFVSSGMDEKLGGGIYWCEQRKESKNTCSNAPSVVYLVKLFEATGDIEYLREAKALYQWTKKYLMDVDDEVYFDNINLNGTVDERKYAYNTGQMIQAGALLYKVTNVKQYLDDAQGAAKGGYDYFFYDYLDKYTDKPIKLLKSSNNWFIAVMMRGFIELSHQDKNDFYVKVFQENLDYAWKYMRDVNGLFNKDWSGGRREESKWLLDQFAIVEMYCKIGVLNN